MLELQNTRPVFFIWFWVQLGVVFFYRKTHMDDLPTREEIEAAKKDIQDSFEFAKQINMEPYAFLRVKINMLLPAKKKLYLEIYNYMKEKENE